MNNGSDSRDGTTTLVRAASRARLAIAIMRGRAMVDAPASSAGDGPGMSVERTTITPSPVDVSPRDMTALANALVQMLNELRADRHDLLAAEAELKETGREHAATIEELAHLRHELQAERTRNFDLSREGSELVQMLNELRSERNGLLAAEAELKQAAGEHAEAADELVRLRHELELERSRNFALSVEIEELSRTLDEQSGHRRRRRMGRASNR
jgi:uncharacterized protein YkwD